MSYFFNCLKTISRISYNNKKHRHLKTRTDIFLEIIEKQGFEKITIHKQKEIAIPADVLVNYLSKDEIINFQNGGTGIYSITVSATKLIN
jgi:hypothetical protein